MESQPQNPERMINPENFHPRVMDINFSTDESKFCTHFTSNMKCQNTFSTKLDN